MGEKWHFNNSYAKSAMLRNVATCAHDMPHDIS